MSPLVVRAMRHWVFRVCPWALAFYRAMSCRTVKAVARGRGRRVQVRVRVRVGVAVGAKAALRDGTLMLPRSGIFSANATRLELATIAVNLPCVVGMFTDSDHDLGTARSVRRFYPRQFGHVAA